MDALFKRCPDCGRLQPISEYGPNRSRPDGLQFYCRRCLSARSAAAYRRLRARNGKTVREPREVPAGQKFCPACQLVKPHAEWHRNSSARDGFTSYCKACRKAQGRVGHLKRAFGLSPAELAQLIEAQDGRCAICRSRPPQHIDHDHRKGDVRGVLCGPCNMGLGQFRDDPSLLHAAARYLHRHLPIVDQASTSRFELDLAEYFDRHRAG